jgi:type I restriction enzyme S subunit
MKPSGIDWLGDIPAHWEVKRLRFTARLISGATPTTSEPDYWDGDLPWISPKDMHSEEISSTEDQVTKFAVEDYGLRLHRLDNPVIVVRGMILARRIPVSMARGFYTINQDMKVIASKGELIPEFIQMYLASIESFLFTLVAESGHGTKTLRTDVLSDVPILIPPKEDQAAIVKAMSGYKENIDDTLNKVKNGISALLEYRAALVTAAVTGKLEIA